MYLKTKQKKHATIFQYYQGLGNAKGRNKQSFLNITSTEKLPHHGNCGVTLNITSLVRSAVLTMVTRSDSSILKLLS